MKYSLLYQDNQYMEKNTFFAFKYRSAVTPGISQEDNPKYTPRAAEFRTKQE